MSEGTINDDFIMPTAYCSDHDWGDDHDASFDLGNLFEPHNESIINNKNCSIIKSGFGKVMTTSDCRIYMYVDHCIEDQERERERIDNIHFIIFQ